MVKHCPVQIAFLIDDSEVDLFVQKKFLEIRQFANQIVTFTSAVQALEVLTANQNSESPGIVFLDLNMPVVNGFEFLEQMRESSTSVFDRIKVVILTSSTSLADRERAQSFNNVISFIPKPLTVQGLDDLAKLIETKI
ncbi:MAG TPA: response regulator [Cyclobacteriaceae bacterium]|nr:response regulator [Cyclobacteriaceae bacterium]HPW63974.1 response regulator [Cyclobacteriaceae bacterium]